MIEKLDDYALQEFIDTEGTYTFKVIEAEMNDESDIEDKILTVTSETLMEVDGKKVAKICRRKYWLKKKARPFYVRLIRACLPNMTECDFETVHEQLIGKKYLGVVKYQEGKEDSLTGEKGQGFYNITEEKKLG